MKLYQHKVEGFVLLARQVGNRVDGTIIKGDPKLIGINDRWLLEEFSEYHNAVVITPLPDCPTLVVTATNPLAVEICEYYAEEVEDTFGDTEVAARVRGFSAKIAEWQKENQHQITIPQ